MPDNNIVVAVYETHEGAEKAVKELQSSGFDMKRLSIVGKNPHAEEQVVGFYNAGDRIKSWGKSGAFLGWHLGAAVRSGIFRHPRHRSRARGRPGGRLDCRRPGNCGSRGRSERHRRGTIQHWPAQGQRPGIRDRPENR